MQFTSLYFLFGFLPLAWLIYQPLAKTRFANVYIMLASFAFYAFGSLRSLFILLFILVWNYISAFQIAGDQKHRKQSLWICIAGNILVLFVYRCLSLWFPFITQWLPKAASLPAMMPAGLSFYIFSCLSYVFDVYYQKVPVLKSFTNLAVYAAFFGRVNMGPIGNYQHMETQLASHPCTNRKNYQGSQLFIQGLFRKVVLADGFGQVFAALAFNSTWLGSLLHGFAYFFQLYFDFSGYSRMARGLGFLFGFEIPANFDLPYTALSVQDFWRRWHISLTSWFRNYVYIPLGGNRVSRPRWIINILCVWLLTGLWHGASWPFIVWGLLQGGLILSEKLALKNSMNKWPRLCRHLWVIVWQLIGWTFFFSPSLSAAFSWIGRYFFIGISSLADREALFWLSGSLLLFVMGILLSSQLSKTLSIHLQRRQKRWWPVWQCAGYCLELLVCLIFMVSSTVQTFLYAVF